MSAHLPDVEAWDLPDTTYAILGLLTFGERSGYDLTKLVNQTIAQFFFRPAKSQIYAELRRLVAKGYATEREVAQQVRPDKRLYAITDEGRGALRSWLDSSPTGPDTIRSPTLLKLSFGGLMDRPTLVSLIEDQRRQATQNLACYEVLDAQLSEAGLMFASMVARRGIAHERGAIAWATQVLEAFDRESDAT
ncbi:MAG: transcriptional regulator PadR [Actinomycetota bacterium]